MSFTYFEYDYIDFGKWIGDRSTLIDAYGEIINGDLYFSNTSIVKLSKGVYLYSVKTIVVDRGKIIIPGNSAKCKDIISVGKNYWWNRWNSKKLYGTTLFFIGNHLNGILTRISIHSANPMEDYRNMSSDISYINGIIVFDSDDYRLLRVNDMQIYLHNSNTTALFSLYIDNGLIYANKIFTPDINYFNGKNIQVLTIKESLPIRGCRIS